VALLKGDGFVLRARPFAESDLILTLFTDAWGRRTAIAKRARRFDSPFGASFDLLNHVEVVFYPRARMDLVSQGTLLEGFGDLKRDLERVSAALAVARVLDRLLPLHQQERGAYVLFGRFLALLDAGTERLEAARLAATLKVLSLFGHRPHLQTCLSCGGTSGQFLFSGERGGVLCGRCAGGEDVPLSRGLALALDSLTRLPLERSGVVVLSPGEATLARDLLAAYVDRLAEA